jgi:FMN reductase
MKSAFRPHIVGIGGTLRPNSSSEMAMRFVLRIAEELGASTEYLAGVDLVFPMFSPESAERTPAALRMIDALRRAQGVVLASPGYHGSISGLIKNALDYTEDMRADERMYLAGRAVGCIACAGGAQAAATTLNALRSVVHALRGWPTPMGLVINTAAPVFDAHGACLHDGTETQLRIMAQELMTFAHRCASVPEPVTSFA